MLLRGKYKVSNSGQILEVLLYICPSQEDCLLAVQPTQVETKKLNLVTKDPGSSLAFVLLISFSSHDAALGQVKSQKWNSRTKTIVTLDARIWFSAMSQDCQSLVNIFRTVSTAPILYFSLSLYSEGKEKEKKKIVGR